MKNWARRGIADGAELANKSATATLGSEVNKETMLNSSTQDKEQRKELELDLGIVEAAEEEEEEEEEEEKFAAEQKDAGLLRLVLTSGFSLFFCFPPICFPPNVNPRLTGCSLHARCHWWCCSCSCMPLSPSPPLLIRASSLALPLILFPACTQGELPV